MSQLIQYIVVRGDLLKVQNWPLGALITQCCHAATAVNYLFRDDPLTQKYFEDLDNMHKVVLEVSLFSFFTSKSVTTSNFRLPTNNHYQNSHKHSLKTISNTNCG